LGKSRRPASRAILAAPITGTSDGLRLPKSLMPQWRKLGAPPRPPAPNGRPRRQPPHWFRSLLAWQISARARLRVAALLVLASAWYGVVRGDTRRKSPPRCRAFANAAANAAGFGITESRARRRTGRRPRGHPAARRHHRALLAVVPRSRRDARAGCSPIHGSPRPPCSSFIPAGLRIEIKERKPYALWQDERRIALIAADGTCSRRRRRRVTLSLPLVVGKGAGRAADALLVSARTLSGDSRAAAAASDRRYADARRHSAQIDIDDVARRSFFEASELEAKSAARAPVAFSLQQHFECRSEIKRPAPLGDQHRGLSPHARSPDSVRAERATRRRRGRPPLPTTSGQRQVTRRRRRA